MCIRDRINPKPYIALIRGLIYFLAMSGFVSAQNFDISEAEKKVFRILSINKPDPSNGDIHASTGSGFLISKNLIATNYHVAGESFIDHSYCMRLIGGLVEVYNTKVVWQSKGHDLTILEVENLDEKPFQLYTGKNEKLQKCFALGFPGQLDTDKSRDAFLVKLKEHQYKSCLLYTSPSPRDRG